MIEKKMQDDIAILHVDVKHLDMQSREEFMHKAIPALEGELNVLLDLEALEFIDSSGIGALLSCKKELDKVDGKITIATHNVTIKKLLDLVRLTRVISIFNTVEEALSEMKKRF